MAINMYVKNVFVCLPLKKQNKMCVTISLFSQNRCVCREKRKIPSGRLGESWLKFSASERRESINRLRDQLLSGVSVTINRAKCDVIIRNGSRKLLDMQPFPYYPITRCNWRLDRRRSQQRCFRAHSYIVHAVYSRKLRAARFLCSTSARNCEDRISPSFFIVIERTRQI